MGVKFGILADGSADGLPEVSRVEIHEQLGETITYTVVFAEDVCDGDFKLLKSASFMPCKEIAIWVEVEDKKVYLVRGPIKGQQIKLANGGQGSELQIKGSDNTIKMKQEERFAKHKNETDEDIVLEILGSYGFANVVFMDNSLFNDDKKNNKVQNQDDLTFLKQLANEKGLHLWMTYEEEGNEIIHFNKLPLEEQPAAKLVINAGINEKNNIDELSINWDADAPTEVVGKKMEIKKKEEKDAKEEQAGQPKLGDVSLKDLTKDTACHQNVKGIHRPIDHEKRGEERNQAALNEAEWFIKANCSTSFDRICKVIHAHTIVEIEGAGSRHSGKYVVSGVTHTIDESSYKMQLELMRNAWTEKPEPNGLPGTGQ